jgi:recombinational DNA repair protein RecT
MPLPSEEFDKHCNDFAEKLIANGQHWKAYFGAAYNTRMRECIKNVRAACDEMEKVLDEDAKPSQPVRELTPEEYEKKVATGKKLTFAPDSKPQ